ncbi:hypothetical protein, conserved [Eimeria brunetti]|uniref:Uncharacterized protein n=1 Tax=Eimeria brunetti TaxID=51314 RepID=U6LE16_9EIME|nr:hypothetical protein, conserved [Eimeria brunetti]
MNSKGGALALTTVDASGTLGGRKLGVLQQQGGTTASSELLTLPAMGVACCSSSCSSSSSPAAADEAAENWSSTGGLIESPASAGHRPFYCCLGACSSRCEADNNSRCNSSCSSCGSPTCSCRGNHKWWGVQDSSSSCSCCCSLIKDVDCSIVCSTSNRPEERQLPLVYASTEATKGSSDTCKSSSSTNSKGCSPSRGEYKWRGRMNLFLRRAVLGDLAKSINGSSSSNGNGSSRSNGNSGCYSTADARKAEATSQEQQQDKAPRGMLVGAADTCQRTQESEQRGVLFRGAPLSRGPIVAVGCSWQDVGGPRGQHAETRTGVLQEVPATEVEKPAAVTSSQLQQLEQPKQQQPLLLLRAVKELRSSASKKQAGDYCGNGSIIGSRTRQPLRSLPVAYSSSNSPAAAGMVAAEADSAAAKLSSPAAAATPTAAATTPTAAPTTPAAAATPTTAATTPTAAAATPTAAPVTHTARTTPTAAPTSIAGATPKAAIAALQATAATPTTATTQTTAAKILAVPATVESPTNNAEHRPSEPSISTPSGGSSAAVCQQGALSCEPRFCYSLEHILAGLCWGPPCLCGTLQDTVRWGFGVSCSSDSHLVNPQQELELLLQRAAATATVGGEGSEQGTCLEKIADERCGGSRATQASGDGSLWCSTGDSLPPMRSTLSAAEGDSFGRTPWRRSGPEDGSVPFFSEASCPPPVPESCSPISDWGSPAQQWAVPQRTELEGTDSSSCSSSCSSKVGSWNPTLLKKRGYGTGSFSNEEKDEGRSYIGLFAPLLGFEGTPKGAAQTLSRYPRTALCADAFVCSGVQWFGSSEDEAGESGAEGCGRPFLPLPSCSARFCGGKALEVGKPYGREGRRRREGGIRDRNKLADGFRNARDSGNGVLYTASKRSGGTSFCLRPNAHQHLPSAPSGPATGQAANWGDIREADRTGKFTAGPEGTSGCGGSRWRDGGREETRDAACSSSSTHQTVMEIAAVPVRTRKGFRKPLPLPPEMLAAIAAAGPRRPVEPVLQYDGESREWRVFWMEEPQARYKVFQSKKFGKERAQQLALEWLHRAKAGAIHGSGRGPRVGGPSAYRFKRGRHEGPHLATEYKHSSPETLQLSTPRSALELSPEASPSLTPFPTAIPAL